MASVRIAISLIWEIENEICIDGRGPHLDYKKVSQEMDLVCELQASEGLNKKL